MGCIIYTSLPATSTSWRTPPTTRGGRQGRLYYGTQVSSSPPSFTLFVNDPKLFGDDALSPFTTTKKERTDFELSITRQCLNRELPVFGICGGEQLLAVALGGQLIQHIPACPFDTLQHEQKNPRNEAGHEIQIMAGTLLHKIVGVTEMSVNSAHHQAVAHPGPTAKNNACAPDGIIEGIESPLYPFCLGVQWHPEFHISEGDRKLFEAFVSACTPRR